jgi:hypothetical protein
VAEFFQRSGDAERAAAHRRDAAADRAAETEERDEP